MLPSHDTPILPLKNGKRRDESDDVPIWPNKINKPPSDDSSNETSETDAYVLKNTKERLEDMKKDFFDVCLENFERNEAEAIAFFVNCMKEAMGATRDIASITRKMARRAEQKEAVVNHPSSVPKRGVRQNIARAEARRRLAQANEKRGYFRSGQD